MRGFIIYDKFNKLMLYEPSSETHLFLAGNGNVVDPDIPSGYLMDRYIRMDSIGLFDKNGKEIYEGYLLKNTGNKNDDIFEVFWDYNHWAVRNIRTKFEFMIFNTENCIIIGNKCENPELIGANR